MNLTLVEGAKASAQRRCAADPPQSLQQLTLLARVLGDVMLANVQNAASLNLSAARALLAHARIPVPAALDRRNETWRWTWRNFEICATSADQVLNLARGHVDRTTAGLWRAVERLFRELTHTHDEQVAELRCAFDTLREAQAAYWRAAQNAHSELVALAQRPVATTDESNGHGQ